MTRFPDMAFNLHVTPDCETNTMVTREVAAQMHSAGARFVTITCAYEFDENAPGVAHTALPVSVMIEGWRVKPGEAKVQ